MNDKFERKVIFTPVRDGRNPDPSKDYGIQSIGVFFVLYGEKGIVEFQICSRWVTPKLYDEIDSIILKTGFENPRMTRPSPHRVFPADVCRWSVTRISEDDIKMSGIKRVFGGGECYYDYKHGGADEAYMILCNEGDEGVWKYLEDYYREQFDGLSSVGQGA